METKEMNLEGYAHSEGVEVKVSAARVNITILLYLFFFVVGAVVLFNYIWGAPIKKQTSFPVQRPCIKGSKPIRTNGVSNAIR